MSDSWDERRKAQEEGYFDKQNKLALERLAARKGQAARPSPITGKPMEQITVMGVVVDKCTDSGGVWLDAGELDEIIKVTKESSTGLSAFVSSLLGK